MISMNRPHIYTGAGLSRVVGRAERMKKWQVIYQTGRRPVESFVVEVAAVDQRAALHESDRLLIAWGDKPERYKRPVWGFGKIETVREVSDEKEFA